ncbi:MAG: hypothetical protein OHK0040_12700 [bacterium]
MCESNVYVKKSGVEELVFSEVMRIVPEGENEFTLVGLLGDTKKIKGVIKEINLLGHKIIFEEI